MTHQIYTIALSDARKEYETNSDFREVIQSGCFVYIENSYVIDMPKFINRIQYGILELTDYARQHIDECALAFDDVVIYKYTGSSTRGDTSAYGTVEKRRSICYKQKNQRNELTQDVIEQRARAKKQFESQLPHSKTCWQRIYEILQERRVNSRTFRDTTLLNSEFYSKAKTNHISPPELRTIIAIAAGYSLGLHVTEELLKLAGHAFNPTSKEHDAYIFIITSMYGYDIDAKNALLIEEGFKPLGSKPS